MNFFVSFTNWLNNFLWGPPIMVLLVGCHLIMTVKTGFIQKYVFKGIKLSVQKDENAAGDISPFQSLATALASTVGTGNIIGVCTAIIAGGPGAVLWTWLVGITGIATKYAESLIAVKFRVKDANGSYIGGAMTALDHLGLHPIAVIFAVLTFVCSFGIGCGVQSNAIAGMLQANASVSPFITGLVCAAIVFVIIIGGVKSISKVCEMLVPFMTLFYTVGCIYILFLHRAYLGQTISLIISSAFTPKAAAGGFVGSTVMMAARFGISRGLFSNEAGMGSAPIVASASQCDNAVKPALISSTGVFWDTVVVCLMTGLVIVSTIVASGNIDCAGLQGAELASLCFSEIKYVGIPLLTFGVVTFAFSTILGWFYYAERCIIYLFKNDKLILFYRLLWVVVTFIGAVLDLGLVWTIADNLNAMMAIPNLIALFLLINVISDETKKFIHDLNGKDPDLQ